MHKIIQKQYKFLIVAIATLLFSAEICFAAFTIDDERKLGKEFFDKLNQNNFLLKDRQLNEYITQVGSLVLAQSKKAPFDYTFSVVDSSAINAFATPGGYIYLHKGLISAVDNEAELAGVIAHELAHANARHIARIIEKSTKLNMAALAAMIAGAFLGGGGEASAAIAAFSLAGAGALTLKYQREHEEEADRLGITYLFNAGYDPSAMVSFLRLIKKHEFLSKSIPSYMRTHPGTDERIFYLESLILTQYTLPGKKNIVGNLKRIQALLPMDIAELKTRQSQLTASLIKEPDNVDLFYALAMTEDKLGQTTSALAHLQKALAIAPLDKDILKTLGLIYLKTGDAGQAETFLQKAISFDADDDELKLALGKTYFSLGNYRDALHNYLAVKNTPAEDIDINYYIATAYGKLNNLGESHYHFGLYFKKEAKTQSALFHFKEALNYFPQSSPQADTINNEIKALVKNPPGDSSSKPKN